MAVDVLATYLEPWYAVGRETPPAASTITPVLLALSRLDGAPLGVFTPYEQLVYLAAVEMLNGLPTRFPQLPSALRQGMDRADRARFALRSGTARERRRAGALALLREYRAAAEPGLSRAGDFLNLAVGLAVRPLEVPPLLLGPVQLVRRLDAAAFATLLDALPAGPYDQNLLTEVHSLLRRTPSDSVAAVNAALDIVFDAQRAHPRVVEATTWLREVATLANAGARLRTSWAMYAPPDGAGGSGTALDLVVALLPRGGSGNADVRIEATIPDEARARLESVVRVALQEAARAVGAQPDAWTVQLWVHDLPGGTVGGPLDVETAESAGLPLTIACAAALTGRPLRPVSASTGTIEPDGRIGSVKRSIPAKIGGLLGWLNPRLDTNLSDPATFVQIFVAADDELRAKSLLASAVSDRVHGVRSVDPDVLRLEDGPLLRPRFSQYLADPLRGRPPRSLAPGLTTRIFELASASAASSSSTRTSAGPLTTALMPWWLPPEADPLSALDPQAPLMFVEAGGVGDALLLDLARQARNSQVSPIPIFLNANGTLPPGGHGWLSDAVRTIVGPGEADQSTIYQLLHEGAFTFVVDADRLGNTDFARLLDQQRSYPGCRWVFLAHVTRAGAATHLRHRKLDDEPFTRFDLIPGGRNSSVWDRYLQRALGDLLKRFPTVKNEPRWLTAHFGSGEYARAPIARYLSRRLGAPQDQVLSEARERERERKVPAALDSSPQGLFAASRSYPLEVIRAPSGRGKSFEVLATIVTWLVGEPRDRFAAAPLYLDAGLLPSLTDVLIEALNASPSQLATLLGKAFREIVAGYGLRDAAEKVAAIKAAEAIGEALGLNLGDPEYWPLLLHGLGPTVLLLDGLREVPDSELQPDRIVPNLIRFADLVTPWGGMVRSREVSERSDSRVVLLFRTDVVETPFARAFAEQLKQHDREHRVSELLPVDQEDVTERYLKPELERLERRPIFERLEQAWQDDPQLLTSLASDLRLLPAVTRLELEHLAVPIDHPTPNEIEAYDPDNYSSILKLALERRWDPEKVNEKGEKGDYVEVPVWRLYGGQILRWALIRDFQEGFERELRLRHLDDKVRALPATRRMDRQRELIALGLLAFRATAKGQGVGQLSLRAEVSPVLERVFRLQQDGIYSVWEGRRLNEDAEPIHAYDACARELERITGRVWVKGDPSHPDDWWLDFRHEEDRVLATVWLIDYVLEHQTDPAALQIVGVEMADGSNGHRRLEGLDLVRYAFALHDNLSEEEVNRRRSEWAAVYRLYEEASHKPRLLFELPEVRRRLGMVEDDENEQ